MSVSHQDKERRTELLRKAQKGDRVAYEALLKECLPMVRGFLRNRLAAKDAAEDLTQQVLLRMHMYLGSCQEAFDAWLFTIARHVLFDHHGHEARLPRAGEEEAFDEPLAASQERNLALGEALRQLPHDHQRAVQLTKIQGLDTREAAVAEGISEAALKVRVHRAIRKLRSSLWVEP